MPPEILRVTDWRTAAACREEDPDLFFPNGEGGPWLFVIDEAKAVCRRCPVVDQCLTFALDEAIPEGIFGGLTEKQRAGLRLSVRRGRTTAEDMQEKADQARQPHRERTLQTIFDDNTVRTFGGHLAWTGGPKPILDGHSYTPKRIAFITDRGRDPEGRVLGDCGIADCVLPAHLTDQPERAHQRHLDADAETQQTGTATKAAA